MSGILALVGAHGAETTARAMLARLATRGGDASDLWIGDGVALGVTRHDWETSPGLAGPAAVTLERDCACVTDATLFYRDELRRALAAAGEPVAPSASPASLVIAAYRAWGDACAARLEGDFAFALWDRRARRLVAARELTGKRPLFHASPGPGGATLAVASSVGALGEDAPRAADLDLRVVAATLSQLWASTDETWHRDVRELLPATTLVGDDAAAPRTTRHWSPSLATGAARSFDDAADELRALLVHATAERFAPDGPTAVWLSGGWDSSAVFAAGQAHRRDAGDDRALLPVSLSYPPGDPGREDELIDAIARRWNAPVRWIDVDTIPLFVEPARGAAQRDGPFAHTYEHWNRRLATESRALGARVALDGNGGDQLFALSDIYLADLFGAGQWLALAREWRAKRGGANWRAFLRYVVVPGAPAPLRRAVERVRGRPFLAPFERRIPDWVRDDFLRTHDVAAWERSTLEALRHDDEWRTESLRYLVAPAFGRAFATLGDFARDAGVELRSPLLDARVVAFASARPRDDRNAGLETKRLLRRAMRGLLPDAVLAPREERTGITSAYSDRQMRAAMPALLDALFARPLLLAELGVVEPARLRAAWDRYLATGALHVKIPLFLTLHTELWLRARLAGEAAP